MPQPPTTSGQLADVLKVQFSLLEAYASAGDVAAAETCRQRIQSLTQGLERRADKMVQRAEARAGQRAAVAGAAR